MNIWAEFGEAQQSGFGQVLADCRSLRYRGVLHINLKWHEVLVARKRSVFFSQGLSTLDDVRCANTK